MEIREDFLRITGYSPYSYQLECISALINGKSLLLSAPTGSGKTEIPIIPFILKTKETLPPQIIYTLPTRTLIENLSNRAKKYGSFHNRSVAIHHGKRIESSVFDEDIIVTTIDQVVGAYLCTPLSAPKRRGNIFGGGVSSAFLVFDEVHTLDPKRALQTALILIEHTSKLKMPVCVMSATLPETLIEKIKNIIKKHFNDVVVRTIEDENEIPVRKNRNVTIHLHLDKTLTIEEIKNTYDSVTNKKIIVICNTVEKAQNIFENLKKEQNIDAKILLIHSRYIDEDRKEKEKEIQLLFSRDVRERVILISTQVIEVGVDISANTVLTEIAPIDSLIQRAGRCARWGGSGEIWIYDTEKPEPYNREIIEKTREELKKYNNERLCWDIEKRLVNEILSRYYDEILKDTYRYEILGILSRAAYDANKTSIGATVREGYTCNVSIYRNPKNLEDNITKLQKVGVDVRTFKGKVKNLLEEGVAVWKIEESNMSNIIDDYTTKYTLKPILDVSEILPFNTYIVSPECAYYDKEVGLILGRNGNYEMRIDYEKTLEEITIENYMKNESWEEHCAKTLSILDNYFLPRYDYVVKRFANIFKMEKMDLIEKIRIGTALHDIGKLNKKWQNRIKWDGKHPLAHTANKEFFSIGIPHATVSAYSLHNVFYSWDQYIGASFYLAVAHHHTPMAKNYDRYEFINGWKEIVKKSLENVTSDTDAIIEKIIPVAPSGDIGIRFIDISSQENIISYRLYCFLSKLLRLSDWYACQDGGQI